jgi:NADH dehydrogenase
MPIHCTDLINIIYYTISQNVENNVVECIGPETLTFKEILKKLLKLIQKKRILIPFPLPLAKISASILGILPKPLLTSDQLRLLNYDNIASGKYKTNFDIGLPSKLLFEEEVEKYCYMWREGGQYSTKKYNLQKNN